MGLGGAPPSRLQPVDPSGGILGGKLSSKLESVDPSGGLSGGKLSSKPESVDPSGGLLSGIALELPQPAPSKGTKSTASSTSTSGKLACGQAQTGGRWRSRGRKAKVIQPSTLPQSGRVWLDFSWVQAVQRTRARLPVVSENSSLGLAQLCAQIFRTDVCANAQMRKCDMPSF